MPNVNYIEKLYELEEGSVKEVEVSEKSILIHVEFSRKVHSCPACCTETDKIKDYYSQRITLESINGKVTYAVVNKRRYCCPHCGKTFYEAVSLASSYQRRSRTQVMHIIHECSKKQSFTEIARRYHVSIPTVIRYFSKVSFSAPKFLPEVISIDEFKGNAQGQRYQVAIVDPVAKKPLDILPKRDTEEIEKYFCKNFSYQQRCKVNLVVTDLSVIFRKVIRNVFPNAKIVADRYHVMRLVHWAMERVRKRVQNEAGKERIYFKRSKYLINKNLDKLKPEDIIKLEDMLHKSKDLGRAYMLKECFRKVLKHDVLSLRKFFVEWLDLVASAGLSEFKSVLTTFTEWKDEIFRGFVSKYSNGYIEGHNNKIKVIKRLSFGIKSFSLLRLRILYLE